MSPQVAHFVVAAARQFGSDRGDTGLVADIADLALMTHSGHSPGTTSRFFERRLSVITLGEDANVDATRFVQSLVFTDKANAAWPQLVERFRSDCRRQFQYLRGPGQAANVSEHVRGCVVAKVRAETGRAGVGEAGAGP